MNATPSDGELLDRARDDPAALEALYRRHVARLMAHAARRCRRPEDVADLVATTFVVVLESAERYDAARGEVLPWMIGIASHLASDSARSARRERDKLVRLAGLRSLDADEIAELEERIDAAREGEHIELALELLPEADREVLWLVGNDGLTPKQAARVLGVSPAALRMRLMRARRALHTAMRTTRTFAADADLAAAAHVPKEAKP